MMNIRDNCVSSMEKAVFTLRELYGKYGYAPYKMTKFEEYDLYVRNKDFLISDSVITFTDTNGRLLALKPDVTLSIVKNGRDGEDGVQKVYYNETVYRVSEGTHAFREIMQTGLECIGDIDTYCLYEVLSLAAKSLDSISPDFVLDVSHLGVLSAVFAAAGLPKESYSAAIRCLGEKNLHELTALCEQNGLTAAQTAMVGRLVTLYGAPDEVLAQLRDMLGNCEPLQEMASVLSAFADTDLYTRLRVDFSVVSDTNYYNGFVFKGFISGVPDRVLSGGQYDKLMKKMGRKDRAIGFAIYLDVLERLGDTGCDFDADIALLYDDTATPAQIAAAVRTLTADGKQVVAAKALSSKQRVREVFVLQEGQVTPQ